MFCAKAYVWVLCKGPLGRWCDDAAHLEVRTAGKSGATVCGGKAPDLYTVQKAQVVRITAAVP